MNDVMFAHNCQEYIGDAKKRILEVTQHWGSTDWTPQRILSDSPEAAPNRGRSLIAMIALFFLYVELTSHDCLTCYNTFSYRTLL